MKKSNLDKKNVGITRIELVPPHPKCDALPLCNIPNFVLNISTSLKRSMHRSVRSEPMC